MDDKTYKKLVIVLQVIWGNAPGHCKVVGDGHVVAPLLRQVPVARHQVHSPITHWSHSVVNSQS